MKTCIIIGASTGIGYQLALEMSRRGYAIGITARREDNLRQLAEQISGPCHYCRMDTADTETSRQQLTDLIQKMGGTLDILVLNAAIGVPGTDWPAYRDTIDINISGTVALASVGIETFKTQGHGHLVGISSVAGVRGLRHSIIYSASKAFLVSFLQGLDHYTMHTRHRIHITDIRPGFVETPMTEQNEKMFWLIKADHAARLIADAIQSRRRVAYIPGRWRIIATLMRNLPRFILRWV